MGNLISNYTKSPLLSQARFSSEIDKLIKEYLRSQSLSLTNGLDYTFFVQIKNVGFKITLKSSNSSVISLLKTDKENFLDFLFTSLPEKMRPKEKQEIEIVYKF